MASVSEGITTRVSPVRYSDRLFALRLSAAVTLGGLVISLLITVIGILLTGQRDWLAGITLALLIPLVLLPPLCYPLLTRFSVMRRENRSLRQLAREDHLTGLFNRPHLISMLERELSLSQRHDYTVSVLLVDITDFTDIADRHGRQVGDRLLRVFSERIGEKIRDSDLFGRIDGAQFLLVLPHTDHHDALHMAESLRSLATTIQLHVEDILLHFDIRIGVASTENCGRQLNPLLNEADYSLYQHRNDRHAENENNLIHP